MKKVLLPLIILLSVTMFFSCNGKKSAEEKIKDFQQSLTTADTTKMLSACDSCMQLLKAGKIDDALSSLYEYDDSTCQVSPLSDETANRYRRMFTLFPVVSYELVYYSFQLEGLNDVKYKVKFADDENIEEAGDAITSYMFNPVKIGDSWYVTVKRADQSIDKSHI